MAASLAALDFYRTLETECMAAPVFCNLAPVRFLCLQCSFAVVRNIPVLVTFRFNLEKNVCVALNFKLTRQNQQDSILQSLGIKQGNLMHSLHQR